MILHHNLFGILLFNSKSIIERRGIMMKKQKEEIMKIRYHSGYSCRMNGVAVGTPKEIVNQLFRDRSPFIEVSTKNEYMEKLITRIRTFHGIKLSLKGKTDEARCRSFLNIMLKSGSIKKLSLKSR